ncbi:MAG: hypothetical protein ACI8Y6_001157 [Brevundimonas sp.]
MSLAALTTEAEKWQSCDTSTSLTLRRRNF